MTSIFLYTIVPLALAQQENGKVAGISPGPERVNLAGTHAVVKWQEAQPVHPAFAGFPPIAHDDILVTIAGPEWTDPVAEP
jgi:hypothetical protein